MQLDKGKREVSFTESRCWMNTSARSTSSIDFTRWTFPRLILSNKLGLQQKGMGLVWRIYASNYELSQKLLEVPPGDFENRWEHIMPFGREPIAILFYMEGKGGLKLVRPFLGDDRLKKTEHLLYTRADAENVVLADCRSASGVLSSEMAYFGGSPDSTPDDTAIIDTSYNTTQQWANATTSTLFSDTGTTFTAVLRPEVAQGDWAGTGDNGYGSLVCWERSLRDLY
ncbi:hypothetical protein VSDG_03113 [Cytospora chrysosperma]|uniref:Uncharacterized protein n=1 Tax=Cytospora chrysosperma TaxID=252740 RepID=A0A423W8R9_CYTCH|nr:hypothetical protein VSDG_03113 [Valsa sordida]